MSMGMSITLGDNAITARLTSMMDKSQNMAQFFQRNVIRKYLTAQQIRYETQNSATYTQGGWKSLNPVYSKNKLKRFANYDGHGSKMGIATGKLMKSVLALSGDYRQVVGDKSFIISTVVDYMPYFNKVRDLKKFTQEFYDEIVSDMRTYITS